MVRARLLVLFACLGWFAACAETQHPGDESASSDDDVPRHTSHRHKKKNKKVVADEDSDDAPKKHKKSSGDDDDDDAKPDKPAKKKAVAKKHAGDDDDDDDDAAAAKKKAAAKKAAAAKEAAEEKAAAKKEAQEKAAEERAEKKREAEEKAAEEKAAKKKAAEEKAEKKREAAEEKAAAKKEAEDKAAEEKAAKKKAAEDDTPKVTDDDEDEDEDKPKAKVAVKAKSKPEDEAKPKKVAGKARSDDDEDEPKPKAKVEATSKSASDDEPKKIASKAKAKSDDEDDDEGKPKKVAPKRTATKTKAKSDDEEDKPKSKTVADEAPEPPHKQRSIEEDVAIDDPLAAPPPKRAAAGDDDDSEAEPAVTTAAPIAAPKGTTLQDRSLTTPQGQLDLHAGLPIGVLSVTDAMGMSTSSTSTGLALGVAYGVNDKAELGFDYTLGISPGALKGPITLHGAYALKSGKLDLAGAAALAIDFADTVNPTTMTTTSSTYASLQLGAWARYHATPTVTLFSGLPAIPNASSSVTKLAFPLPVLPYQLQVGLSGGAPIALTLPIGLGYQASPKLYAFGSLDLANIRIANTSNAFLFKDFIPLALGGFYQLDTLDVGATFADDLKQGFGYLRFELVARYRLH